MKKKNNTPTPHDAIFRQFLTNPDVARDFMDIHLPEELRKCCDLNTLQLESGSFVESDLRQYFSDVLYSLKTANGDGYIYVLIEHQSRPDKHMAFRLMRYAIAAMQRHLDAGHQMLPLVIPMLFYCGKRSPYPYSNDWINEFADPITARRLYGNAFPVSDITTIPDDEIMQHRRMAALTLIKKHIRLRDIATIIGDVGTLFMESYLSSPQVKALLHYLIQAGETTDPEALIRELARRAPQHGETFMTIAQQLEQKGREKGIAQGITQGIQQGVLDVARRLLKMGMPLASVQQATGLSAKELEKIAQ